MTRTRKWDGGTSRGQGGASGGGGAGVRNVLEMGQFLQYPPLETAGGAVNENTLTAPANVQRLLVTFRLTSARRRVTCRRRVLPPHGRLFYGFPGRGDMS